MTDVLKHKRGDTFVLNCQVLTDAGSGQNINGWTIASKMRNARGVLLGTMTVSVTDAATGKYTLTVLDTTAWTLGPAMLDIRYADSTGRISTTENILYEIERAQSE